MKRKRSAESLEAPIDLASRIGMPSAPARLAQPHPAAPETVRRVDGPIEASRGRPLMIGTNEPLPARQAEAYTAAPARPALIGEAAADTRAMEYAPLVARTREAPALGEMDLVVTPLPTPDDWHHFELALRRLPGVGPLRPEYYRAGILKLRVRWSGAERFAQALAKVPGYRVGILGEDRSTVQIRVGRP